MAVRISTGTRDGIMNSGLATLFDTDGRIDFYTGTQPASADDDVTGTLLATLALAADAVTAGAAAGVITFAAITSDTSADADGVAGWARVYDASELVGGSSTTKKRIDLDVGEGSGSINMDETTIVENGTVAISSFTVTLPAS